MSAAAVGCAICRSPATCFGAYEGAVVAEPACDDCCGHACEDGCCVPIEDATLPANAAVCWPVIPGAMGATEDAT